MQTKTLALLRCPACKSDLTSTDNTVSCRGCGNRYPIMAGVLVLVEDVEGYLLEHAKGISRYVEDKDIPKQYRTDFLEAKSEIRTEHIEEDLEAERVTALYLMTHYLRSNEVSSPDPALDAVIKQYWDHGPFAKIKEIVAHKCSEKKQSLIELGCGVGGLYAALHDHLDSYLGLDSSFASIALARHFALGQPLIKRPCAVPHDLLGGAVSREINIPIPPPSNSENAEFIVCDLSAPPVKPGLWQMSAALNVIDMLPRPEALPQLQYELLSAQGVAIQSCPYIWHPAVSAQLRQTLPHDLRDSAKAVKFLYEEAGFKVEGEQLHLPWIFFKNIRQLEIYSVHLFCASKVGPH